MTLEVMKMFGVKARRNMKRGAAGSLVRAVEAEGSAIGEGCSLVPDRSAFREEVKSQAN